jgi:hypothetical protein
MSSIVTFSSLAKPTSNESDSKDKSYPYFVQKIFSIEKFETLPLLVGDFIGQSEWIDQVTSYDMKNNSIMRGVDDFGRTFVSFKMLVIATDKKTNVKTEKISVFTLFNRQKESMNSCVIGKNWYDIDCLWYANAISYNDYDAFIERMKKIISGEEVNNVFSKGIVGETSFTARLSNK